MKIPHTSHLDVAPGPELAKYPSADAPFTRTRSRASSLDHCQVFFRLGFRDGSGELDEQQACLQLGFYLASWGMYRGSGFLHRFSSAALSDVVAVLASAAPRMRDVDVGTYDNESIGEVLVLADELRRAFPGTKASDTLVSKTMLGVFGCTPAFDGYFSHGLGMSRFDERSLLALRAYYDRHHDEIDRHRSPLVAFDGGSTRLRDTQARVIDRIFFAFGGGPTGYR